jgi:hypothetical protein
LGDDLLVERLARRLAERNREITALFVKPQTAERRRQGGCGPNLP